MIKLFLNDFDVNKNKKIISAINKSMASSVSWDIGMLVDDSQCLQYVAVFDKDEDGDFQISLSKLSNSNLSKELKCYSSIDDNKLKNILCIVKEDIRNHATNYTAREISGILRRCGLTNCCDLTHLLEDKEINCEEFVSKLLSSDLLLYKGKTFTKGDLFDFISYISLNNKRVVSYKSFENAIEEYILSNVDNEAKEKIKNCYNEYMEVMNKIKGENS